MTQQKWKSRSINYDKNRLIQLQQASGEKLEEILDYFGLDLKKHSKFYVGSCPIHGGDNESAFNIFHSGYEHNGNWRCFTHHCEKHFQPSVIGFVRAMISKTKYGWESPSDDEDKLCPFKEVVDFLVKFTNNKDLNDFKVDYQAIEKKKFVNKVESLKSPTPERPLNVTRDQLAKSINIPSNYFISRDVPESILVKYDVGCCMSAGKPMNMRAVVPIYDDDHELVIGCTGRALFEKCPICECHHNPVHKCPEKNLRPIFKKWKHNSGFRADQHLYNYWFAKDYIRESKVVVLVEGPGDVWKLEQCGIHNSVGLFGSALKEGQRNILDKSGALAMIILTDPDNAGRLCIKEIKESCASSYSIYSPSISQVDIGDTPDATIKEKLIPILKDIERDLND